MNFGSKKGVRKSLILFVFVLIVFSCFVFAVPPPPPAPNIGGDGSGDPPVNQGNGPSANYTGNISINSNPIGATIYFNGLNIGVTPKVVNDLNSGQEYSIKLVKEGYNNYTTSKRAVANQTVFVTAALVRIVQNNNIGQAGNLNQGTDGGSDQLSDDNLRYLLEQCNQKEDNTLLMLFFITNLILIIIVIVLVTFNITKVMSRENVQEKSQVNNDLIKIKEFIVQRSEEGYDKIDIVRKLLEAGWAKEEIDKVYLEIDK